jgi:hypothetical protein
MNVYREMINIKSNKVVVMLPKGFYHGKAEVQITPLEEAVQEINSENIKSKRENFRKLLLQRPFQLTDEDVKNFKENSKWIRKWKPKIF